MNSFTLLQVNTPKIKNFGGVILFTSLLTIFQPSPSLSQTKNGFSFDFSLGIEERITPIYPNGAVPGGFAIPVYYDEQNQITGSSVNSMLGLRLRRFKLSIEFCHTIRYDHIYYESGFNNLSLQANGFTTSKSVKGFLSDYNFCLRKYFEYRNSNPYLMIGFALMNVGSEYALTEQLDSVLGLPVYITSSRNFTFTSLDFAIGMIYKKFDVAIKAYYTGETKYNDPSNLIIPAFQLGYFIRRKE